MCPIKVGDTHKIMTGSYKGVRVRVTRVGPTECRGECIGYQETADGDCFNDEEEMSFRTPPDPKQTLDKEIVELATQLRGAILARKSLENPVNTDKEIKKLLNCVKL